MGSNFSTPVVEGVDNRPILSMGGRMCTWYQSAHPARLCRLIGSVPWLCCYHSAVVVMLERDVAIGLNANRWRHLTLFIQIHGTHCVGKCITPPLKKCFHHCSGITVNVIHPIDQGRTRYLTCVQHCRSVMWRGVSRNACIVNICPACLTFKSQVSLPSDGKNASLMWRIWACDVIILETVFAVIIAGAVAPSRAVGQMHAGFFCLSALLRLSD